MTPAQALAAELRAEANTSPMSYATRQRITSIAARLDALGDGWRGIESAPRDGSVIWVGSRSSIRLAFWKNGAEYECRGTVGGGWRDHSKAECRDLADLHFEPTHWMPIPTPPKEPK